MALLARREAQLRANEERFHQESQILHNLEKDLRTSVRKQKIWKKKIMVKIVVASLQQNRNRQHQLIQRLDRINQVRDDNFGNIFRVILKYYHFRTFLIPCPV